jgi:stage V sporulation protein AD
MGEKHGDQTYLFTNPPSLIGARSVVGPREAAGPLGQYFDLKINDPLFGERTAEKAERRFLVEACNATLEGTGVAGGDIDFLLAGDLLNQIISASFTARELKIPFLGLYGACSTVAEASALAGFLLDGGFGSNVLVGVSSHYQTAERQYRYPIELNLKHKLSAQYTVTGAGAFLYAKAGAGPYLTGVTVGKIVDYQIKDPNDMGAAMAPAAADTILQHLEDTGREPNYYDLILTGDLGKVGMQLTSALLEQCGVSLGSIYQDGGAMMFGGDPAQGAGGSGCACSAVITAGYVLKEMAAGKFKRALIVGTGSLHSPLTWQQGESIPGIAHAFVLERQGAA